MECQVYKLLVRDSKMSQSSIQRLFNNYLSIPPQNLRAACSYLINAISHLFRCINDEEIPRTTNESEGYFTHRKEKLTLHKGLRFEKRKNFIKWYVYFKNPK